MRPTDGMVSCRSQHMQENFFDRSFEILQSAHQSDLFQDPAPSPPQNAELTRIFNAAILATRTDRKRDFAAELYQLVETPAFEVILQAIRSLAQKQAVTDRQAAEHVIDTFRKIDSVWTEYAFQEGVDRLRGGS